MQIESTDKSLKVSVLQATIEIKIFYQDTPQDRNKTPKVALKLSRDKILSTSSLISIGVQSIIVSHLAPKEILEKVRLSRSSERIFTSSESRT